LSRSSAHASRTIRPVPRSTELADAGSGCPCWRSTSRAKARVSVGFVAERVGRGALRQGAGRGVEMIGTATERLDLS
jgi:hypothetical protein